MSTRIQDTYRSSLVVDNTLFWRANLFARGGEFSVPACPSLACLMVTRLTVEATQLRPLVVLDATDTGVEVRLPGRFEVLVA